ncbi:hypothetical protein [Halobacterium noricense]|nr:hypothetical protein [Halobacterium noricense]
MSSGVADDEQLSREERSRRWREEHDLEPYALEYEDEAADLDAE